MTRSHGTGRADVKASARERDRGWRVFVPAFRLGEVFPVQMLEPGKPDDDRCEEVGWGRKPQKFGGVTYQLFDLDRILDAIELSYSIVDEAQGLKMSQWLERGCLLPFPVGEAFKAVQEAVREDQ